MDRMTELNGTAPALPAPGTAALRYRDLLAIAWQRVMRRGPRALPATRNLRAHLQFVTELVSVRFRWQPQADAAWHRRVYRDYQTYLRHQAGKLPRIDLAEYDRTYRDALRTRLEALPLQLRGARVLCLGARIGTEVKAFLDVGAFAIGIDLNPGPSNQFVVHGDFHHLQYPDGSADVVFSNSLDHVFDVARWTREVRRVLRPGGTLLLEVGPGVGEGGRPEFYEALCWTSVQDLAGEMARHGFRLAQRRAITSSPPAAQLLLERE